MYATKNSSGVQIKCWIVNTDKEMTSFLMKSFLFSFSFCLKWIFPTVNFFRKSFVTCEGSKIVGKGFVNKEANAYFFLTNYVGIRLHFQQQKGNCRYPCLLLLMIVIDRISIADIHLLLFQFSPFTTKMKGMIFF